MGEERKKPRAEPWEMPIFQELAKEGTRLGEMELDQPKGWKSLEDNGVIGAKGLQVGIATCLFQMRMCTMGCVHPPSPPRGPRD